MFYFCALNICELSMRDVRVFTSSERKEMVSLLGATQNEIAKGAMDAWTIVLQARTLSYRKVSDFGFVLPLCHFTVTLSIEERIYKILCAYLC